LHSKDCDAGAFFISEHVRSVHVIFAQGPLIHRF